MKTIQAWSMGRGAWSLRRGVCGSWVALRRVLGLTIDEQRSVDCRGAERAGLFALRSLLFALLLLPGAASLHAQNADSPHEGLHAELSTTSPGDVSVRWWAKAGRTYFIQTSETLMPGSWSYLPTVEVGADALSGIVMPTNDEKLFVRLVYTDQSFSGGVADADFDGDGVANGLEVAAGIGGSPFLSDTDGDGVADADELATGTNLGGRTIGVRHRR